MCGICGVFGNGDSESVRAMLGVLNHRGPDDEHMVCGPDFALGARRLSIIDLEHGRQPVTNETGTVWAVLNGELYNLPELRSQILNRGHKLNSRCDTETLPHLYEEYMTGLVERIDGMFAIAVWDDSRKTGLLARDRMGKKPLYYHRAGDSLYFASEIKALLRIPGFQRKINLEALHHFLSYKHVPHPLSIFEGISILPPAHMMVFRPGTEPQISRYWDIDFSAAQEAASLPEEEIVERLLALFKQGLKRRLMSDVPIGFFLSGGLDSSLTTALATELAPGRIKTFSLTYTEGSTTEGKEQDRHWARWVADKYKTDHYEETIDHADFPQTLRSIIGCFDEPFSGVVSTYFLAQKISQHVKVAISGDGADELFGSYLSHRLASPLANYREYQLTGSPDLVRPFEDQPDFLARFSGQEDWDWRRQLFVRSDEEKAALYAPEVAEMTREFNSGEHLRQRFASLTAADPLNRILEAEFRTILPDEVLTFVDRLSMAHSLEVRTAFLDTDFVSFVAGLPGNIKIKNGETKYILKKAALNYLPAEMVFRKKEGFLMPLAEWMVRDLESYVRDTLSRDSLSTHGLFDIEHVQSLVDGLYRDGGDYTDVNKVLSLLAFQEWYELYMMGSG